VNVTIIGIGNMARGIATRLLAGGNSVTLVGREPERAQSLVADLMPAAKGGATVRAVPESSPLLDEMVILAIPYSAVTDVTQKFHKQLAHKIVVDITNTLNETYDDLATPPGTSGAEEIAKLLPATRVIKAFNTTFASTLVIGAAAGQPLDVFIAGDDGAAKKVLGVLVEGGGMRPIDVGPLKRARQLEGLGLLAITLQFTLNTGFKTAWKFVTP
jgi:8-hydroxy-5-deazaflavin:NADPH oxidoreductase